MLKYQFSMAYLKYGRVPFFNNTFFSSSNFFLGFRYLTCNILTSDQVTYKTNEQRMQV